MRGSRSRARGDGGDGGGGAGADAAEVQDVCRGGEREYEDEAEGDDGELDLVRMLAEQPAATFSAIMWLPDWWLHMPGGQV